MYRIFRSLSVSKINCRIVYKGGLYDKKARAGMEINLFKEKSEKDAYLGKIPEKGSYFEM